MGRQAREFLPLPLVEPLGALADQDHEQRYQRRGDQHDGGRDPVDRKDHDQDRQRQHDHQCHGRQVTGIVCLERLDAIADRGGQFSCPLLSQPYRTHRLQVSDQLVPNGQFYPDCRAKGRLFRQPAENGAQTNQRENHP